MHFHHCHLKQAATIILHNPLTFFRTFYSQTPTAAVGNSQIPTVSHEVDHRQLSDPVVEANNNNHNNNNSSSGGSNAHQLSAVPQANPQQQPHTPARPTNNSTLVLPIQNSPTLLSGSHTHIGSTLNIASTPNPHAQVSKRKETLEAKRERKAAKTLAIITGAFVVCWLPFFLMALLLPLCESCYINDTVMSLFLWLGYFNSTLNPVIYTIFSPEFRQAFKRILFGTHRGTTYRRGKL